MAQQNFRNQNVFDEYTSNMSLGDMERMAEIEEELVKSESGKVSIAGVMALAAGGGLLLLGVLNAALGALFGLTILEGLHALLMVAGVFAASYGVIKTIRMVTRKNLDLPSLSVLRKTVAQNVGQRTEATYQQQNKGSYAPTQQQQDRKLRRSRKERVFTGVAGGLAEYMGISPALVRFFFIFSLFATSGASFFAYLLMSIILPKNYDDWRQRY
jgi:phage shock protein PspC (stress-responsive transcriptional regulator)